jgi:hypothetical protein
MVECTSSARKARMQICDIKLVHRLKQGPQDCAHLQSPHLFYLDTCQRQLWITLGGANLADQLIDGVTYNGEAAYEKLLSIACGLESRIIGETEVYAQIRTAWRKQRDKSPIDDLLTKLFEDIKFIRSNYLTGIGGQSYSTLIRKHLQPTDSSHFLIVGAGELAASLVPMLTDWRITLTNRSTPRAERLATASRRAGARIRVTDTPTNLPGITDTIICRPLSPNEDQQLLNLVGLKIFVHMGASANDIASLHIPQHVNAASLTDIFTLQVAQDELRLGQVEQARQTCRERATLRNLGPSVCLPHGWEDLAAFGEF